MLEIEATSSTPHICYDEGTHTLSVSGESYPENSFEFYAPVFGVAHEDARVRVALQAQPEGELHELEQHEVRVGYPRSSLRGLGAGLRRAGSLWFYDAENERALDLAEEFKEDIDIPFEIVPVRGAAQ